MGLVLSILVACVGVIELLSFCSNVRRNLTLGPIRGGLSTVRENYIQELSSIKKATESELQTNDAASVVEENYLPTDRHAPAFRLISHEDIEIEYKENVLARAKTSAPRRFLVTEKEVSDHHRSPSPRHFVVSEEPQGLKKSQCQASIPEYFVQEQKNSKKSPNRPRYVLKDDEGRSGSPIPLPSQFLITEKECSVLELAGSSSNVEVRNPEYNHDEYYRRSPSPYPPLDLPQTARGSICNELVDHPVVSVLEVDEDLYRSRSSSPKGIEGSTENELNFKTETSNLLEFSNNKASNISDSQKKLLAAVVIERAKCKSESDKFLASTQLQTIQSEGSQVNGKGCVEFQAVEENYLESSAYDENYLNNLDGIGKQKFVKRNYSSRKTIKRLSINNSLEESSSKSEESSNKDVSTKILTDSVEQSTHESSPSTSVKEPSTAASTSKEPEVKKEPEPFWLIFSGEYTKAMNKDWHGQHFCCWQCDESLTGQRYVLRDDHPYCVSCYESVFANACEKCSRTIGIDSKDLSYKDKHWHEACFLCTTCGESLVDKQFGSKGDRIYCGSCYDQQFASRCDGCHEIFRAGTKKMEYKTRQWHEKCFCCCVCKVPIGTQSFIPREQEIYCAKCYEEKFATRCIKCNKVITSGGVTYKNEPWHRECFTCTHCQKSLAGERFTSRDEKPFCAECFGELFAKRCTACNKPITGIGGTKFISFEDRHWHNDCFFCASCRTSLVGRGFITDNEDIICPECAKQKLM